MGASPTQTVRASGQGRAVQVQKEMSFRMQTVAENFVRIALDRTSVTLSLPELEYLLLNLTTLKNQLARYKLAEADVSS
jgi:hypothetical protein